MTFIRVDLKKIIKKIKISSIIIIIVIYFILFLKKEKLFGFVNVEADPKLRESIMQRWVGLNLVLGAHAIWVGSLPPIRS